MVKLIRKFFFWLRADVRIYDRVVLNRDLIIPKGKLWFIGKHGVIETNGYTIYINGALRNDGVIQCEPRDKMQKFEIDDDMVERAAIALYGELTIGTIRSPSPIGRSGWDKEALRIATRRILAAATNPEWGNNE